MQSARSLKKINKWGYIIYNINLVMQSGTILRVWIGSGFPPWFGTKILVKLSQVQVSHSRVSLFGFQVFGYLTTSLNIMHLLLLLAARRMNYSVRVELMFEFRAFCFWEDKKNGKSNNLEKLTYTKCEVEKKNLKFGIFEFGPPKLQWTMLQNEV